ncbi:hypothetical protein KP509_1Z207400 [Ceratopteris richardii]|nr:hypothetical protein KP509_1Z207400 [Ceratopteris richardii]
MSRLDRCYYSHEKVIWQELLDELNCKDLWSLIGGHAIRYTFHSRSHKSAMSRLDRCYYSHVHTLNTASKMWIDATMLLSYHNPLLINLQDLHRESCTPSNFHKIPLRLNLAWLHTSLFKSKVHTLIQQVLSLEISACMKWESFVEGMQEVIRECGKCFTSALAKDKIEVEQMILCMSTKVDSGKLLSETEYMRLCDAYRYLQIIENNAIQSSKVRARYTEVNDLHANSKCFFDLLRTKRLKDTIITIETDGLTLHDGNSIAELCSMHFKKLFAASFAEDDACLQSLKNGKAPGIDGITKEFVAAFWPSLKTLVLDLRKIKLIPKVQVPKRMEDWRPISMMSIIYKIFAKIFALRLKPIMHKITHPSQTGFVYGRSIYDNIFLTQILMEHAISSNQQIVGMQIDFEKAFDRIRWDFIAVVLKKLGFGVKFSRLIYVLARDI